jgi:hypothetical protein
LIQGVGVVAVFHCDSSLYGWSLSDNTCAHEDN